MPPVQSRAFAFDRSGLAATAGARANGACSGASRVWKIGGNMYLAPADAPLDASGMPAKRLWLCTAAAWAAFPEAFSFAHEPAT